VPYSVAIAKDDHQQNAQVSAMETAFACGVDMLKRSKDSPNPTVVGRTRLPSAVLVGLWVSSESTCPFYLVTPEAGVTGFSSVASGGTDAVCARTARNDYPGVPAEHPKHGEVPEGMRVTNLLDREIRRGSNQACTRALLNFVSCAADGRRGAAKRGCLPAN